MTASIFVLLTLLCFCVWTTSKSNEANPTSTHSVAEPSVHAVQDHIFSGATIFDDVLPSFILPRVKRTSHRSKKTKSARAKGSKTAKSARTSSKPRSRKKSSSSRARTPSLRKKPQARKKTFYQQPDDRLPTSNTNIHACEEDKREPGRPTEEPKVVDPRRIQGADPNDPLPHLANRGVDCGTCSVLRALYKLPGFPEEILSCVEDEELSADDKQMCVAIHKIFVADETDGTTVQKVREAGGFEYDAGVYPINIVDWIMYELPSQVTEKFELNVFVTRFCVFDQERSASKGFRERPDQIPRKRRMKVRVRLPYTVVQDRHYAFDTHTIWEKAQAPQESDETRKIEGGMFCPQSIKNSKKRVHRGFCTCPKNANRMEFSFQFNYVPKRTVYAIFLPVTDWQSLCRTQKFVDVGDGCDRQTERTWSLSTVMRKTQQRRDRKTRDYFTHARVRYWNGEERTCRDMDTYDKGGIAVKGAHRTREECEESLNAYALIYYAGRRKQPKV